MTKTKFAKFLTMVSNGYRKEYRSFVYKGWILTYVCVCMCVYMCGLFDFVLFGYHYYYFVFILYFWEIFAHKNAKNGFVFFSICSFIVVQAAEEQPQI